MELHTGYYSENQLMDNQKYFKHSFLLYLTQLQVYPLVEYSYMDFLPDSLILMMFQLRGL